MTTPTPALDVLHIVRRRADDYPLRLAERGGPGHAVLLCGEGLANRVPAGVRIFAAAGCAAQRGLREAPGQLVDDAAIVELIAAAHKVIGW